MIIWAKKLCYWNCCYVSRYCTIHPQSDCVRCWCFRPRYYDDRLLHWREQYKELSLKEDIHSHQSGRPQIQLGQRRREERRVQEAAPYGGRDRRRRRGQFPILSVSLCSTSPLDKGSHPPPYRGPSLKDRAATWGRPYGEITNHPGRAGLGPLRRIQHQYRWLGKARRRSGTAPVLIFERPGPSGPAGIQTDHSDFARRKCFDYPQGITPVMGVWGKAVIGERSSPLRRPPASFGSFSTWKRNSPRRANPCKNITI